MSLKDMESGQSWRGLVAKMAPSSFEKWLGKSCPLTSQASRALEGHRPDRLDDAVWGDSGADGQHGMAGGGRGWGRREQWLGVNRGDQSV